MTRSNLERVVHDVQRPVRSQADVDLALDAVAAVVRRIEPRDEVALDERGGVLGLADRDLDIAHPAHHRAQVWTVIERSPVAADAAAELCRTADVERGLTSVAEEVHARSLGKRPKGRVE